MASTTPPPGWSGTGWAGLPVQERAVQWAAYYADKALVREVPVNRGRWVEKFLRLVGLAPGYAWCAAFVSQCLRDAGWTKFKSAAVWAWHDWAAERQAIATRPRRGDLAFWLHGQSRHIEIVIATEGEWCPSSVHPSGKVPTDYVHTIGGNTSSGKEGSQNDGDGVYRRLRHAHDFDGSIRWWQA